MLRSGDQLGVNMVHAKVQGEAKDYLQKCCSVSFSHLADTNIRGYAFVAGFLYSYCVKNEGDLQAALKWGVAAGSTCVTKVGASVRPTKEEILSNMPS